MVAGWERFTTHFRPVADEFVVIGGTAATLAMEEQGLDFRATRDIDVVLCAVAGSEALGTLLWSFLTDGGYQTSTRSDGAPFLHRFLRPSRDGFPPLIELFATAPLEPPRSAGAIQRVTFDGAGGAASAILMDSEMVDFLLRAERRPTDPIRFARADRLIPLKAVAWHDLSAKRAKGEQVDWADIKKHRNDVLRLTQLLTPDTRVELPPRCGVALRALLDDIAVDPAVNPKQLNIPYTTTPQLLARVTSSFQLGPND
jgi:hypothetical protein